MSYKTRVFVSAGLVLVAGAAVAAYAFFGAYASKVESVRESVVKSKLFRFDPADVASGEVTTERGTVRFERSAAGWQITQPVAVAGDRVAIKKLIESVASITSQSTIELTEKSGESKYGLDEPSTRVTLELAGGSKAELRIGAKNDFDGRFYAKSSVLTTASLVDPEVATAVNQSFLALREKRLFELDPHDVLTFEAMRDGKLIYSLVRKEGRWYFRVDPTSNEKLADQPEAMKLVETLLSSRAGTFADDSGSDDVLGAFGLTKPVMSFAISATGGRKSFVRMGAVSDPSAEHWYLKVDGTKSVAEVAGTLAEDLTRSAADLEDRKLLDLDESSVVRIRIGKGATFLEFEKNESGDWVSRAPATGKPKGYKLSGIVHAVATVRATRYDTNDPGPQDLVRAGLRPPMKSVTLHGAKGLLGTLWVGRASKESTALTFAMAEGAKKVAVVETSAIDSIPDDLAELLEGK